MHEIPGSELREVSHNSSRSERPTFPKKLGIVRTDVCYYNNSCRQDMPEIFFVGKVLTFNSSLNIIISMFWHNMI